jgi:hypothetical protein
VSENNAGLISAFLDAIETAKLKNKDRLMQLLGYFPIYRPEIDALNPSARESVRQKALEELEDAVASVMSSGNQIRQASRGGRPPESQPQANGASHLVMRAIERQGNFIARRHRAEVLRNATYVRRIAHTVARRESHSNTGGLYDRRVESPVVRILKQAT